MFKLFSYSFGLKHLDKIQITDKTFMSASNSLSKGISKMFSSQEAVTLNKTINQVAHIPFIEKVEQRKLEASRSILVQVQSEQSYRELHTYCSSIGTVKNMFHYTTGIEPMHFILVEFAKESELRSVLNVSAYNEENIGVPTQSHFLWFRAANRKLAKLKQSKKLKLNIENGTSILSEQKLMEELFKCTDISDQIVTLYNFSKLNDLGTRLRFLTALQIETCLSGMFPNSAVYPFGSTVNGFGRMGCDLDLVLRLNLIKNSDESRLVFHCKAVSGSERSMHQKYMELLGDIIHLFLPGCTQVRRILQARIPIIKFHQQLTDIECDLSMSNMSGVYMSDFLYMMGELDERVRPLVFVIRQWAKAVGITNSSPGKWISNFSLSLLVLAFLQKPLRSPPILPSLNTLVKLAGSTDEYITEDGIDCTFLRNLNNYNHQTQNTESLETLLKEFFEYFSLFDFSSKAVCLNEAATLLKPEYHPMYIINPLEKGLNVSKNVSIEEVERFMRETRNAAWILESQENKELWGILGLLDDMKKNVTLNFSSKPGRLMEVSDLFEEEETNSKYKNLEVKQQVEDIKKYNREQIKHLVKNVKNKR